MVLADALAESVPDALIASGDITQDGEAAAYLAFMEIVRRHYSGPMLCTPGNHDLLEPMQHAGLPMAPLSLGDWQLLALDSHADGELKSAVTDESVEHCFAQIRAAHVLLCTHHPLLPVECPWLDSDRTVNPQLHRRLGEPSPVRGLLFGHLHQEVSTRIGAVPLYGTPSTCFQFLPKSQRFSVDTAAPGYRRIRLHEDGTISTVVRRTAALPQPPRIGS
jgi:Icc protein